MDIKTQTDALQEINWLIPDDAMPGSTWYAVRIAVERGMAVAPGALTPAQEHAEELHRRLKWALGFVETYAREAMGPATPEWDAVRDVVELVDPPKPPTSEELATALAAVTEFAKPFGTSAHAFEAAKGMLVRARRSGLLKQ